MIAPPPPHKQPNTVVQQLNSQNHDGNAVKLGKASYKTSLRSSQLSNVINDVSASNASTRQPTPGISESMALLDTSSLDNYRTSKSNLTINSGRKSDLEKSPTSAAEKGPVKDGEKLNTNRNYKLPNINSKFPPLPPSQQPPLWQTVRKLPLENKRVLYNAATLGGERHQENDVKRQVWGRAREETVADIEGLFGDIGSNNAGSNTRKPQEGCVVPYHLLIIIMLCNDRQLCLGVK